jgi:hypothetical protein
MRKKKSASLEQRVFELSCDGGERRITIKAADVDFDIGDDAEMNEYLDGELRTFKDNLSCGWTEKSS